MSSETQLLFHAVTTADTSDVQRALATGADVNASDKRGRNIVAYAALGDAIDSCLDPTIQPRLSPSRIDILHILLQHPDLSLYSLNTALAWAGGFTILGLMSWHNMANEISCLLMSTQGLVEVDAMDEQGMTPLMYAARDGRSKVVQLLLAHGARPDLRDATHRSAVQFALRHPHILWLFERILCCERSRDAKFSSPVSAPPSTDEDQPSSHRRAHSLSDGLLFFPPLYTPPQPAWCDGLTLRLASHSMLCAVRKGDVNDLRARLSSLPGDSQHPEAALMFSTPLLVNLQDSKGMSLIHHAVSQGGCPSISVIDELYSAGADVGLFSTRGLGPLHYLARMARDDPRPAQGDEEPPTMQTNSLHVLTTHLMCDLQVPLGAKDNKGETPMHAAAEIGLSVSVLQAMLDYDSKLPGCLAVREARNKRGLRPADVAKPEFLCLFPDHRPAGDADPSSSSLGSAGRQDQGRLSPASPSPHHLQPPNPNNKLAKKWSGRSLRHRSTTNDLRSPATGDEQATKGSITGLRTRSSTPDLRPSVPSDRLAKKRSVKNLREALASSWSSAARLFRRPSGQPAAPLPTPPMPVSTPPGPLPTIVTPVEEDPHVAADVSACALDVLSNLNACASALHAYAMAPAQVSNGPGALPDLSALAERLRLTRELASQALGQWASRTEVAREELERARRELRITERRLERLEKEVGAPAAISEDVGGGGVIVASSWLKGNVGTTSEGRTCARHVSVQKPDVGSSSQPSTSHTSALGTQLTAGELASTVKNGRGRTGRAGLVASCARMEDEGRRPEGRTGAEGDQEGESTGVGASSVPGAPRVLRHAGQDLAQIDAHLATVQRSHSRALRAIGQARSWVEETLKSQEKQLVAIARSPQPESPPSRLPPIIVWSSDAHLDPPSESIGAHHQSAGATDLHRLFTRKVNKYVETMFDELEKAQVWLRIVREVLRGLKRRAIREGV